MQKIAVLWDRRWPVVDAPAVTLSWIRSAFAGFEIDILSDPRSAARLSRAKVDALVLLNGSAFPLEFWNAISRYLEAGGNLIYLGGNPFSRPFRMVSRKAHVEPANAAYPRSLGIVQVFPLDVGDRHRVGAPWKKAGISRCWRFYFRLNDAVVADAPPGQPGWQAPIEGRFEPLVRITEEGHHVGTAASLLKHESGRFKQSKWVLAPCQLQRPLDATTVRELVAAATSPSPRWQATPGFAVYRQQERPCISVQSSVRGGKVRIRITSNDCVVLDSECASGKSISLSASLPKGFYKIECLHATGESVLSTQGFWIAEPGDLASGRKLGTTADWLTRDGKPFAVAGTTYMCGEEHRDFLLRPNSAAWMRDMAAMKSAGTNMIRTGLWHDWARHSQANGTPQRETLRAFEAYLLCAGCHDIPVIFNFFAFVPYAWKSPHHPYLEPKSLEAQKRFLGGFAATAKACDFVAWDLINEPSVTDAAHMWSTLPTGGVAEKKAWQKWLAAEYGGVDQARLALQAPPEWKGALPTAREFGDTIVFDHRHPLLGSAFQRFAQKVFCDWTQMLARELRRCGASFQLVTVGQDEGGSDTRPSPLFHGHVVDFTSNHSWHQNDDLLWDTLIAHKRGKPLLLEEVGIMAFEAIDRKTLRPLDVSAMMLERKLAFSFGGGAGGFIQWLWDTNPYLPFDVESGIGLRMADGTEKPEMSVYAGLADFAARIQPWLGKMEEPVVCVIYPQGDCYSVRPREMENHRRAIRCLEYRLGVATRVVGEFQSEDLGRPRLIVVPAHESLDEKCWKTILHAVKLGAWLTVSGDFRRDANYRLIRELDFLVRGTTEDLVASAEVLTIEENQHDVVFATAWKKPLRKLRGKAPNRVIAHPFGNGTILVSPLPLEASTSESPLLDFYQLAAKGAGVAVNPQAPGRLVRRVALPKADLFALANESADSIPLRDLLPCAPNGSLAPGRTALYLVEKKSDRILAAYEPPHLA